MQNKDLFEKIERPKRLPDEIAKSLAAAIESEHFKPGDRLPTENDLSQQFGVARTVVREAVSLLKYDGVIQSKQGVDVIVGPKSCNCTFRLYFPCFLTGIVLNKF